jgi:hypothetical protein
MANYINGLYWVVAQGGVAYQANVTITQNAWDRANDDVKQKTREILAMQPIPL